jgi:hypothetical protein
MLMAGGRESGYEAPIRTKFRRATGILKSPNVTMLAKNTGYSRLIESLYPG